MNNLCGKCGGSCCKLQLVSLDDLKTTGAKSIHYEGETSNKIANGYIQMDRICPMLKNGKCDIYETRPQACRDFKVGSEKCLLVMKIKNIELYERIKNK